MSALRRLFDRGVAASARRSEALGELAEATALYLEAGLTAEASRLYVLRADHAQSPVDRARLLQQAIGLADEQSSERLRLRRARLLVELAASEKMMLVPSELCALGEELSRLGEMSPAAEAYRLAGDTDAQAESLVRAGAVDRAERPPDANALHALI